jgi:hypothetical protein
VKVTPEERENKVDPETVKVPFPVTEVELR